MATGPKHYLKSIASLPLIHEETDGAWATARAIESLTHATLALAAATALASTGVGEADLGEWTALICEPDDSYEAAAPACCVAAEQVEHDPDCETRSDPYEGMTNADVMSGEELAEYDRDAEFAQDAADEARWAEENAANQYNDAHYDTDDDEDGAL